MVDFKKHLKRKQKKRGSVRPDPAAPKIIFGHVIGGRGLFAVCTQTTMEIRCSVEQSERTSNLCASVYRRDPKVTWGGKDELVQRGTVFWPHEIVKALAEHRANVAMYL